MKYCPSCNKNKDIPNAVFCNVCGTKLTEAKQLRSEETPQDTVACPKCGTHNIKKNKVCIECNYVFTSEISEETPPVRKEKNKRKTVILAVVIPVLLGVLGFVGYKFGGALFPDAPNKKTLDLPAVTTAASNGVKNPQESPGSVTEDIVSSDNIQKPSVKNARTVTGSVLGVSNVDRTRTFDAEQAVDGKPETCWCVNTSEQGGAGAEILFVLEKTADVSGIRIINGNLYLPEEKIYLSNGQIKEFSLEFSNGEQKTYTADFNGDGSSDYQTVKFDEPINTSYIILRVKSGYIGKSYPTNVCLGEFDVF